MVDQRIDHIFFRPGREDQQVLVEGVYLAGDPVDGVSLRPPSGRCRPTVAWLTRHSRRNRSNAVVVESSTLKFSSNRTKLSHS